MPSTLFTAQKIPPLSAGHLRHRVQLQQNQPIVNGFNEAVPNWVTVATLWALIEPLLGSEVFAAQRIAPEAKVRIRLRWPGRNLAITTADRIAWSPLGYSSSSSSGSSAPATPQRAYNIVAVLDPGERQRELYLLAKAAV